MTTSGASKSSAAILAHARKVEKSSTPLLLPGDVLPFPTNAMPDPSKKSHAKKQPPGHIPRPRNAFILFRCDFVRQKKIPNTVENDHRNISRIAGTIWRGMNDKEREPWVVMAQEEKRKHQQNHPGYRFNPGVSGRKRVKRGDDLARESQLDEVATNEPVVSSIDRAASAPPGALRIPQVNVELLNGYGNPLRTRDDLSRRPSRVTLYQSKPFDVNGERPTNPDFFSDIVNQHYFSQAVMDNYSRSISDTSSETVGKKDEGLVEEYANGIFCGPRLDLEPHSLYDRDYPPDWQPAPTEEPIAWNNYSDLVVESDGETTSSYSMDPAPAFTNPFTEPYPPLPRPGTVYATDTSHPPDMVDLIKKYSFQYPATVQWRNLPPDFDSDYSGSEISPCIGPQPDRPPEWKSRNSFAQLPNELRSALVERE